MKPARVLVDGEWRDCTWMYPVRKLSTNAPAWDGEADESGRTVVTAMIGGIQLIAGRNYVYLVATGGKRFTVAVDVAFQEGNNLCTVLSVHDVD